MTRGLAISVAWIGLIGAVLTGAAFYQTGLTLFLAAVIGFMVAFGVCVGWLIGGKQ